MKPNLFALLLFSIYIFAQDRDYSKTKFDVTEKDFAAKVYSIDSSADAVVKANIIGSRNWVNNKSGFHYCLSASGGYTSSKKAHLILRKYTSISGTIWTGKKIDKPRANNNMEDGKSCCSKLDPKNRDI